MDRITENEKFKEILSNIRHYSALRFVMLTVFVAINGAMFTQFFNCEFAARNPQAIVIFEIGGGIISTVFFIFERALDHNLSNYWKTVEAYVGKNDALISNRSELYKAMVPIATHGIIVLAFIFWVYVSNGFYPCIK